MVGDNCAGVLNITNIVRTYVNLLLTGRANKFDVPTPTVFRVTPLPALRLIIDCPSRSEPLSANTRSKNSRSLLSLGNLPNSANPSCSLCYLPLQKNGTAQYCRSVLEPTPRSMRGRSNGSACNPAGLKHEMHRKTSIGSRNEGMMPITASHRPSGVPLRLCRSSAGHRSPYNPTSRIGFRRPGQRGV